MQPLLYPPPLFFDQNGLLLDGGNIYVGVASADPQSSPVNVYWDSALTIPAAQPLRTRGGVIVNNGAPSLVFMADGDYSLRVRDADGNMIAYFPSANPAGASAYQPLNATLTAIAALTTTAFGRSLLTATDANAAKTLLAIGAYLAATGGTISGNIVRASAGPHIYHTDGTMVSGRIFVTAPGAADPTSQDGDIWIEAS